MSAQLDHVDLQSFLEHSARGYELLRGWKTIARAVNLRSLSGAKRFLKVLGVPWGKMGGHVVVTTGMIDLALWRLGIRQQQEGRRPQANDFKKGNDARRHRHKSKGTVRSGE